MLWEWDLEWSVGRCDFFLIAGLMVYFRVIECLVWWGDRGFQGSLGYVGIRNIPCISINYHDCDNS